MPTDLKGYWEKAAKRQQSRPILISSPKPPMQHLKALAKPKMKDFIKIQCLKCWKPSQEHSNMFLVKMFRTFLHPQLKKSGRKCSTTGTDALYVCPSWILDNQSRYLFLKCFFKAVSIQEDIGVLAPQLTGSHSAHWVKWKTHQAILQPLALTTPLPVLFSSKHIWEQQACCHVHDGTAGPSLSQRKFGRVLEKHPLWRSNRAFSWPLHYATLPFTSFSHKNILEKGNQTRRQAKKMPSPAGHQIP